MHYKTSDSAAAGAGVASSTEMRLPGIKARIGGNAFQSSRPACATAATSWARAAICGPQQYFHMHKTLPFYVGPILADLNSATRRSAIQRARTVKVLFAGGIICTQVLLFSVRTHVLCTWKERCRLNGCARCASLWCQTVRMARVWDALVATPLSRKMEPRYLNAQRARGWKYEGRASVRLGEQFRPGGASGATFKDARPPPFNNTVRNGPFDGDRHPRAAVISHDCAGDPFWPCKSDGGRHDEICIDNVKQFALADKDAHTPIQ